MCLLNNLKSDTVSLEVVRPVFPQACTIPQETLDNYCNSSNRHASMSPSKSIRYSTASESVSLANPPKGIQRSASLAQRGAPQPRLAEGKNYSCRQVIASRQNDDFSFSGDESLDQCSSITSTGEYLLHAGHPAVLYNASAEPNLKVNGDNLNLLGSLIVA